MRGKVNRSAICLAAVLTAVGVGAHSAGSAEEMSFKLVYLPGDRTAVVCESAEQAMLALDEFHTLYVADKRPRPRRAKKRLTAADEGHAHECSMREVSYVPKAPYRGVGLAAEGVDWGKGVAHYFVEADLFAYQGETAERVAVGEGYVLISGDAVMPLESAVSN